MIDATTMEVGEAKLTHNVKWERIALSQISEFITKGSTPTTFGFNWVEKGIPFLRSECVTDDGFNTKGLSFISVEANKVLERSIIIGGDILITITGNVGRIAIYPSEMSVGNINQHIARVRITAKEKVDSTFVYYQLKNPAFREYYNGIVTGAAYPQLSLKQIRDTVIVCPSLETQQRIASILSAYDELIEVNNKRIKLLEDTASELYKEWFVRMRFPGYKKVKFVKGVPEGWEVKPMASLCSRITDGTHDTPKPLESGYPLITGKHIIDGFIDFTSAYYISENDHRQISKRSGLNKGDVLLTNIGTIGSASIVDYENEFSVKNVIIYKPLKIEYSAFIFYYLTNPTTVEQFMSDAFGTSQQFLSLGYCRKLKAFIPIEDLILKFDQIASPMIKLKYTLQQQNTRLRQIRDRLLPRLISGKLEVKPNYILKQTEQA